MPHPPLAYRCPDVSALARSLKRQLQEIEGPPGHLQLLNMLARATGAPNFQAWRAEAELQAAAAAWAPPLPEAQPTLAPREATEASPAPALGPAPKLERLLRCFDAQGRLARWPSKYSEQGPCLWALWAALPARGRHDEARINDALKALASLEDHVLLRRELVNHGLLGRTPDGRSYWREPRALPEAWRPLVEALRLRQ